MLEEKGEVIIHFHYSLFIANKAVSTDVPEPSSLLSLLAMGALGAGSLVKSKKGESVR
ncbi:MAG: PEP-CTERM sorting domain-containing protein [Cyanobacteriota bacterium]|nr:PEP-CTERM sorting domain-containing protein [Cyanobacteriota bacterium]